MSVYLKIHEEFMKLGRTVKAFSGTYGVPISVPETHLLREVAHGRAVMAKDIAVMLGVDKGTVSRLVGVLVRRKLLKEKTLESDRRSKVLSLTKEGEKLFYLTHERGNKFIGALSSRLSNNEQKELQGYFREFSDRAKAAPALFSSDQHFMRPELRRFIRVMGFMKARFPRTTLSLTQKEILSGIRQLSKETEIGANDVARLLGIEPSNLSTMISSLEKRSLIGRRKSNKDSRKQILFLTPEGQKELSAFEDELVSHFKKSFVGISPQKCERFALLLSRFSDPEGIQALTQVVQNRIEVRSLKDSQDLQRARATYVEELVREKRHQEIPERLFDSEGINFGLFEEGMVVGLAGIVCEVRGKGAELPLFWISSRVSELGADRELLREILDAAFKGKNIKEVLITAKDGIEAANKLGFNERNGKVIITRTSL